MILADKIINLRKKAGMSQEELADKIGVSRQAVSKWESTQSIPDLDKILLMSKLFDVSTDFLLKDEIEIEDNISINDDQIDERKKVTMEMANEYIDIKFKTAIKIAFGVMLCILSPITLFILGVLSERNIENENLYGAIGIITLLILVAIAVCLFIISYFKAKEYEFITTEAFETTYGVTGMVKEKKKSFQDKYFRFNLIGIILCILGVIPLFIGMISDDDLLCVIGLSVMFFIVSIGVFMIVFVGCKMGALTRLLQEGEYSKDKKIRNPMMEAISSCYWGITVIVYLIWSFTSNSWNRTWLVWPVAGILYGAIYMIIDVMSKNKMKK